MSERFAEVDKLRAEMLQALDEVAGDVLRRIEGVVLDAVASLSRDAAPALALQNRSRWDNVSFDSSVGLHVTGDVMVTSVRSDCVSSVNRFGEIFCIIVQMNSLKIIQCDLLDIFCILDIYYNDPQLFGSQKTVDSIVDDISCMLKVPRRSLHVLATSKGLISGDLCYLEEDGTRVDCSSSSLAVPVSSNVGNITNIVSSAKFVLIVEKDATFQRLLDDDFCTKLSPCIMITGKGVPDVSSRQMVRKLWDTLHIPVFALVDADPHVHLVVCVFSSQSMSFEAHSLTVPSVLWLGLLPSDIERLRVPQDALIPFTLRDERKLRSLRSRPYTACQPAWDREMDIMQTGKKKAEIQSLTFIAPEFLTRVYLPNKLRYGGWI
uniref:DNA topoisomerase (ATP-hydrolyzing) n=1 Tax=Denticeps clupeoides TaxID=299321 RepID=A0AAY4D0D1_9TELE